MEKLKMQTTDLTDNNIEKIATLFPNVITETRAEDGSVKKAVDFDLLRQALSKTVVEGDDERYKLDWPGKKASLLKANTPITKTLRPCKEESVNFDTTENLYIEGDNFEVLKILQESYLGKVKMIYIDPPYNTGNDFIYKDNFAKSKEEYDEDIGAVGEKGDKLFRNTESNGRFHSDWLSMMYERLVVARDLLKDDGVVFMSIDDNEVHNLRKICDEVFGEDNFIANIVWQKKYAATNDAKGFSNLHDHIIVYQKSSSFNRYLLPRTDEQNAPYKNDDGDGRGLWRSDNLLVRSFSESGVYPIKNPNTGEEFYPPKGNCWRASKATMELWLSENRIFFGKEGRGAPQLKRYLKEVQQGKVPTTWWTFEEVGHNDAANKELQALFNSKAPFDTPKPTTLVKQMLKIASKSNDLILDFFSGSSTTAHAVMQINADDCSNRKFIMVQISASCDENSEAYKTGYKTIAEIGKERIRRAGKMIISELKEKNQQQKIGETQVDPSKLDIGFRVYKVDDSNMKDVFYHPTDLKQTQLSTLESNIKEDRTSEDLLTQIILDLGLELSLPIATKKILGNTVYFVQTNALAACFDKDIDFKIIDSIAEVKPLKVVFKDASFKDDKDRINVEERFKRLSPETKVTVL
jgi:adenine-specific DNA-methyltransferase